MTAAVFLTVSMFLISSPPVASARKAVRGNQWDRTTMVQGHIEDVNSSMQALRVKGRYYYFTGVPIINEMGQNSPPNQLIRGRVVTLFFQNNVMSKIMIFESALAE